VSKSNPNKCKVTFDVTDADTAEALGSGDVPVLATPRLLAWCEAACVDVMGDLGEEATSVGTRVEFDHQRATPVGATVIISARLSGRDGRRHTFDVVAEHDLGEGPVTIAHATLTRVVVRRESVLTRITG
jgi:fluoroacetyl-CoA thioesterase